MVSARSVPASVEILTNPTVILAMGLLGAGLVAVWVYWLREGARHRADMQVHDGAGATARRLATRQLRTTAVVMLPAMGLGGIGSALLVRSINGVALPAGTPGILLLAGAIGALSLLAITAAACSLAVRSAVTEVIHAP